MLNRTDIFDCSCQGNWRTLVKEYSDRYGHRFVDVHGEVFTFVGLVDSAEDYYFLMIAVSTGRAQLTSGPSRSASKRLGPSSRPSRGVAL